jgi:two-component system cell cycle sensor histidine kinase/response regulator CckA
MESLSCGSETVLLVDADPEPRKLAAFMLQRRGYAVIEARSSADALHLCESRSVRPDLLLTEILMPGMSGTDLAAKLVALQPEMRVLFMSRTDYNRVARRLEINRDLGFLQKPFTMVQIASKVRRALDSGNAPRPLTAAAQ